MTEETDGARLRDKIKEEKGHVFERLLQLSRLEPEELKHHGHKTFEAATRYTLNNAAKEIERWIVAHEKKWSHD